MTTKEKRSLPLSFLFRRLHSLTGLFITLYLFEHLLVNSQAALLVGEDGTGFIRAVNGIHDLPYLPFIELFLLGVPILLHLGWGIQYLLTGSYNSFTSDGSLPSLPNYPRNQAYTWQRITSWILALGIILHVVHMRFIQYPSSAQIGSQKSYMVRLDYDPGVDTLAQRLGFTIYDETQIAAMKIDFSKLNHEEFISSTEKQLYDQKSSWMKALTKQNLQKGQVIAVADSFGLATLLMLRDTFKIPLMIALYTIFTLAACFHGFNGLWTFMISWGITLTERSQQLMFYFAYALMSLVAFWGLATIWGTFWINLKY